MGINVWSVSHNRHCHGPLDNLCRRTWHVSHSAVWHALGGSSGGNACNECHHMFTQMDVDARMQEDL